MCNCLCVLAISGQNSHCALLTQLIQILPWTLVISEVFMNEDC